MATAAAGAKKKRVQQNETRIHLTPTGLLMEGVYAPNPIAGEMALFHHLPNPC